MVIAMRTAINWRTVKPMVIEMPKVIAKPMVMRSVIEMLRATMRLMDLRMATGLRWAIMMH